MLLCSNLVLASLSFCPYCNVSLWDVVWQWLGGSLETTLGTNLHLWMPERRSFSCIHPFVVVKTVYSSVCEHKDCLRPTMCWINSLRVVIFESLTACNVASSCYLCTAAVDLAVCAFCVSKNICLMLSWVLTSVGTRWRPAMTSAKWGTQLPSIHRFVGSVSATIDCCWQIGRRISSRNC